MDRITAPGNARSRRTRAALLDAARSLIEHDGVAALTMSAVAERAGVSRRSAYLHFATRADLLVALFAHVAEQEDLGGVMARVWAAPDGEAALQVWADGTTRYLLRVAGVARALRRERHADADVAAHFAVVEREHRRDCRRLARWLADEGRLAPAWTAETATDMLWALMAPDLLASLVEDRRWSVGACVRQLQALLRSTFVVEPSGR